MKTLKLSIGISPTKMLAFCVALIVVNAALAANCIRIDTPPCAQKYGTCTLVDDTDEDYKVVSGLETGSLSYDTTSIDACEYQCGSDYKGVGHQLNPKGTCPP